MSDSDHHARRRTGIIEILLSGFCFGFLGIFGKSLYSMGILPGELLSLRFLIGGTLLLVWFLFKNPSHLKLERRSLLSCAALGVLGYAVFSSCYFQALTGLSASLTVLLLYLYPVMVAVGAWLMFGEKIAKDRWFVLPIAIVGLVLLVWGEIYVRDPSALIFGVASAVFYSVYILASSRLLKGVDPYASVTYIQLFAGLALALVHWRDPARVGGVIASAWPWLVAMALVCSVAAMGLFQAGLQKLKNWEVSILSTAEPVTAIALAMILLGERMSPSQTIGAILVLLAFIFVSLPGKRAL